MASLWARWSGPTETYPNNLYINPLSHCNPLPSSCLTSLFLKPPVYSLITQHPMPWSHYLQNKFAKYRASAVRRDSTASVSSTSIQSPPPSPYALNELFHAILVECFSEDRFDVFPRYDLRRSQQGEKETSAGNIGSGSGGVEKRTVDFVVEAFDGSPVLFVDICSESPSTSTPRLRRRLTPVSALRHSSSEEDDIHWHTLSATFTSLSQISHLERMFGINVLGTEIVCYEFQKGAGAGGRVRVVGSEDGDPRPDCAFRVDVMSEAGYERMMRIVDEAEWMVQDLK